MPALPLAENVARVICRWEAGVPSERAHIVLHYRSPFGWLGASLADLGDQVNQAILDELMPQAPAALIYEGCTVTDLGAAGAVPVDVPRTPQPGSLAIDMNPPNVAQVISWRTNNASRNGRGRSYIPGTPRSGMTDATHARPAFVTACQDLAAALIAVDGDNGAALGVLSYYDKDTTPAAPHIRPTPAFFPVQLAIVNTRVDTQRRRLGRT